MNDTFHHESIFQQLIPLSQFVFLTVSSVVIFIGSSRWKSLNELLTNPPRSPVTFVLMTTSGDDSPFLLRSKLHPKAVDL